MSKSDLKSLWLVVTMLIVGATVSAAIVSTEPNSKEWMLWGLYGSRFSLLSAKVHINIFIGTLSLHPLGWVVCTLIACIYFSERKLRQ